MADFASLYAKLDKQAEDHDVDIAKVKCPKKQKPAIYVMLAREDTDDAVTGVEVDISKPTSSKKKTDGEGMAKFDPAKVGNHVARFKLTSDLEKHYFKPSSRTVTTSQGKTSTLLVMLRPLPSLEVIVRRSDGSQGFLGDVAVELSGPGKLKQTTAHGSGSAKFPQLKPASYKVKLTLTKTHLEWAVAPGMEVKEVTFDQDNKLIVLVHPKGKVDPTIAIEDPKVVIVKRLYMSQAKSKAKPHRLRVRLGVSANFDGTGQLTCNNGGNINIFREATDGAAVPFPVTLTAAELNQSLSGEAFTLYMEGQNPSAGMDDVQLDLALQGGTGINGPAVNDKLTCVRLKIDIHKWRVDDTTDPVLIGEPDKIDKGRYIHVQNAESEHERAKIIVHQAEPAAFTGKLRVCGWDEGKAAFGDHLQLFDTETGDQSPHPNPLSLANPSIPGTGQVMWVEGKTVSKDMYDAPIRLTVENIKDETTHLVEGDRVTVTVLKTTLQIHQSKTKPDADPEPMSEEDQIKKGRYLHEQNSGFHHGRALVLVKKVEPASFKEKLTLTVWDVTAKSKADPRVELFKAEDEVPKSGQAAKPNPFEFDHDGSFPAKGLKLWAEGKSGKVSAALRDTEIRLGLKDHINVCGRAATTVIRFKNLKADLPSTPANQVRNRRNGGPSNTPVLRHDFVAGKNDPAKHFSDDFTVNEPLPLVEASIPGDDQVKLSTEIEPAGLNIPVIWSVIRSGDDAKAIKNLDGNSEDPGLTPDGADPLKATMTANAAGSFRVRAYIDCNGNNKFDERSDDSKRVDREPFILMNLLLFRVQCVNNTSVANSNAVVAGCDNNGVSKGGGGIPTGFKSGVFAADGNGAVHMKAVIRVIGGGANGKLGLDYLFSGWVNNELNCPTAPNPNSWGEDVTHHHQPPTPAPPPVVPPPAILGLRCYWELDGARISGPILDAGGRYGDQRGTGGDSCIGTMGGAEPPVNKTDDTSGIGQRWKVENVDSPGGQIASVHPNDGTARLVRFKFNIDFQCALLAWTNFSKNAGPTDDATCRLYSTVQTNQWNVRMDSTFGAAWAETRVTRRTVTFTKDPSPTRRATPLQGSRFETCAPGGLNCGKYDQPFDPANPNNP